MMLVALSLIVNVGMVHEATRVMPPDISRLAPYQPPTLIIYSRAKDCPHCVHMKAALGQVGDALARYKVERVTDDPERCERDGIEGVPALVVRDPSGRVVRVHVGAMTAGQLREWLR